MFHARGTPRSTFSLTNWNGATGSPSSPEFHPCALPTKSPFLGGFLSQNIAVSLRGPPGHSQCALHWRGARNRLAS